MIRNQRRPKGCVSAVTTNSLHLRNPWITAWWSAAFPGYGHIILGSYLKGYILILLEIILNTGSRLNLAIIYSFTGYFNLAKEVLEPRWTFLYIGLYIYAIWDSYRTTVDLNKFNLLAERENTPIIPFKMDSFEINYLDKRTHWVSIVASMFLPGAGHLYIHRLTTGFAIMAFWVVATYLSKIYLAIIYLPISLAKATAITDPQWMLFLPSIFGFAIYDSYVHTVEYNRLFDIEQSMFLKDNYQNPIFKLKRDEVFKSVRSGDL
ncbi:MAG: hypothetical protein HPY50_02525 [Firmicutes bacterium]|nr:hypothetical protein [Bacillota bacterium]